MSKIVCSRRSSLDQNIARKFGQCSSKVLLWNPKKWPFHDLYISHISLRPDILAVECFGFSNTPLDCLNEVTAHKVHLVEYISARVSTRIHSIFNTLTTYNYAHCLLHSSHLTFVSCSTLAPACINSSPTWAWPSWQATCKEANPSCEGGQQYTFIVNRFSGTEYQKSETICWRYTGCSITYSSNYIITSYTWCG